MSAETALWLNTNTLIGDTDRRGNAWHYRADLQSGEGNHYAGAIPMEDVKRRLFDWNPVSVPVYVKVECTEDEAIEAGKDGEAVTKETLIQANVETGENEPYTQWFRFIERPNRQSITADDDYTADMGIFKAGYQIHGYEEWLLTNVGNLVDGEVHVSSAGLLKARANAWVELALSDVHTVADFEFRPHLLAFTSLDGSLATTYKRAIQAVVCDNTLRAASSEVTGQMLKVKHSKYSKLKLASARDALGLIVATGDEFAAEIEALTSVKISGKEWNDLLAILIPTKAKEGEKALSQMAITKAENKRERISAMWSNDLRCAPWKGTAFGVVQTFNTYQHHERATRGTTIRPERNMIEALDGTTDKADLVVREALELVTAKR